MPIMEKVYTSLVAYRAEGVFNPWAQVDPTDMDQAGAAAGRLQRLKEHFSTNAKLILIGEAPGYQGCRVGGIPFTNEALLLSGKVPRVRVDWRLSARQRPWSEPSATILWGALHQHGIADSTVMWNAFAFHPHKPGEPYSNRAPTKSELESQMDILSGVLVHFDTAIKVAVGRVAENTLRKLGLKIDHVLRHPSMGGANEFRSGLASLVDENGLA